MRVMGRVIAILCLAAVGAAVSGLPAVPALSAAPISQDTWALALHSEQSSLVRVPARVSAAVLDETGITFLQDKKRLSGQGVTIGLVDTGVDVQALGSESVVSWTDVTSEGRVTTSPPMAPAADGSIAFEGVKFRVDGLVSQSGKYRVGTLTKDGIPRTAPGVMALRDISKVGVVLADSYQAGQYDTVYVDSDRDGQFSDEKPLEVYRNSRAYASLLAGDGGVLSLVVADILDNGSVVLFGFDAHGHGTATASILSGNRLGIAPASPGAALVVVKAISSAGESTWGLVAKGIQAACEQGADVVVVSASPAVRAGDVGARDALEEVLRKFRDVLVVIAAGNDGPGLGTLPAFGNWENLLVVGGYVPSAVAQEIGWGSRPSFYPWSAIGPDVDGNVPCGLGVAMAPVILPGWAAGSNSLVLMEGTSVSAAYAGGMAAVISGSLKSGSGAPSARVKRALEETSALLPGLCAAEQGHGVLRADRALTRAGEIKGASKTRFVFQWMGRFLTDSFFDRDKVPGHIPVYLENLLPVPLDLEVNGPEWVSVPYRRFGTAPVDQRQSSFIAHAVTPGLYSDYLLADDPGTPGTDVESAITVVVPHEFDGGLLGVGSLLGPGELHRQFLRVPPGTESLHVGFSVLSRGQAARGRARIYVYDGLGRCVYQGPWVGAGAEASDDAFVFRLPEGGVWEVVVLSDPQLRLYKQDDTVFNLTCRPEGIVPSGNLASFRRSSDGLSYGAVSTLLNSGDAFEAKVDLLVDGFTGFLKRGETPIAPGISATIQVPKVAQGAESLCLMVSGARDASTRLSMYLYTLDTVTGQWKEVASTHADECGSGQIVIQHPPPGQYVAYVDASGAVSSGGSFRWLILQTRKSSGAGAFDRSSGLSAFTWEEGQTKTIESRSEGIGGDRPRYLVIWDDQEDIVKDIIPFPIGGDRPDLFASVLQGGAGGGRTNVTVRAWDRTTMQAVSACVEIDGVWHQLFRGSAALVLDRATLDGIEVRAEYPGMEPWANAPED